MSSIIASWQDAGGNTLTLGKTGTISTRGVADLSTAQMLDMLNLITQIVTVRARLELPAVGTQTEET